MTWEHHHCNFDHLETSANPETYKTLSNVPVPVSGIWLRRIGDEVQVLFEFNKQWYMGIQEHVEGSFSHNMASSGMRARIEKKQYDPIGDKEG